jgi:2-keto-4-pentenoate hydratase/2-oxohepta-3-ene-1,7-dioic acid hydratase in catechol pathway
MRAVTCLVSSLLVLALVGCGNSKSNQQAAVDSSAAKKSATEKVAATMTTQQATAVQARAERRAALEAGKLASVNSICPVTGDLVDPAIAPIPVEIMIVQPAKIIMVGVANAAAAEAVQRDPGRYVAAAQSNKSVRAYTKIGR